MTIGALGGAAHEKAKVLASSFAVCAGYIGA